MSSSADIRPLPLADHDSAPWWEHLVRHELVVQRCGDCAAWRWPSRAICGRCGSFAWSWQPSAGRGTIASWVVNHHAFSSAFASPYAVVTVRLDEQPDLLLIGSYQGPIDGLSIGLAVEAVFDDVVTAPRPPDGDDPDHDEPANPVTLLAWRPLTPDGEDTTCR